MRKSEFFICSDVGLRLRYSCYFSRGTSNCLSKSAFLASNCFFLWSSRFFILCLACDDELSSEICVGRLCL